MAKRITVQAQEACQRAIKRMGGPTRAARLVGRTRSAVYQWRQVPADLAIEIEKLAKVSRHDLRPDLYPRGR